MGETSGRREWQAALAAALLVLVAALFVMALVARSSQQAPEPIAGLTDAQVSLARAHGLEVRPNPIATAAASDEEVERAAIAALGREAYDSLRSSVNASLARVAVDGEEVAGRLVWIVVAEGVPSPSFGAGQSAGVAAPGQTFVVVDPETFDVLVE